MATRVLAAWYMLGQDNGFPATNFYGHIPVNLDSSDEHLNVQGDHAKYVSAHTTTLHLH